jgi:hypothetical protein
MHFMNLIMLSDYMKALNSTRTLPTNNEHFPMHTLFSTIYLWQEQRLNHNHYFGWKINMNYFIQVSGCDLDMHANIQCMNMHGFL